MILSSSERGRARRARSVTSSGTRVERRPASPPPSSEPRASSPPTHGALGRPSPDEQAQQDVCAELLATPGLDCRHLGVALEAGGQLRLTGSVPSRRQRQLALSVARAHAGDRDVRCALTLEPRGAQASRTAH